MGALSTAAMTRMESDVPWFRALSAEDRSWVGLTLQAGIRGCVEWVGAVAHDPPDRPAGANLAAEVFGAAPRELTGVITLQQTVDLIRLSIEVVESRLDELIDPADLDATRAQISQYAREVAFATALVYARAAEIRGAWDARLEALVVDSVLRSEADEELLSRASALGWGGHDSVMVMLGHVPSSIGRTSSEADLFDEVRRRARIVGLDALCATQGDRLVVILGGESEPHRPADRLAEVFGDGPVVIGPTVAGLAEGHVSARSALSALRAAVGWPDAPRPVRSFELLPERALAGDGHARRYLVEEIYLPLTVGKQTHLETLSAYFAAGASLEATARALFVHPNTVRYRLGQVAEITGCSPNDPRGGFTLQVALVLGRLSGRTSL